ncbi:MAG: ABC transporter ATP-binding protein [Bacteroidota bacterium]
MPYLSLHSISKQFNNGISTNSVLKDVNLDITEGEIVAIVGRTGSGKTTLVSMIAGLIEPSGGSIFFRNKPLSNVSLGHGLIFQHYSLLPWMTVLENVLFGVDQFFRNEPLRHRKDRALRFIEKVNLTSAIYKYPSELSGGMRQRVAVARTLAVNPDILLMDEPLSALDALTRSKLQDEILEILQESKKTAVLITNNVEEAIIMADRIVTLLPPPICSIGKSFRVEITKDPGFKRHITKDAKFIELRKQITSYLKDFKSIES